MSEKLRAVATRLLPAIGYGDAAGLPAEGKTAREIRELYGEIIELVPPISHPFFPYEGRGTTSDDTQLSLATEWSLIDADDVSPESLRDVYVEAYDVTPRVQRKDGSVARGWGGSTINAVERMKQGVPPLEAGEKGAAGNGVVMRMGPLAVWQAFRGVDAQTRYEQYNNFTNMTHDSDMARRCTRLHGDVLMALMKDDEPFDEVVRRAAHDTSSDFVHEAALLQRAVDDPCQDAEELARRYAAGKTGKQYGFYVPETLAIAYDIFLGAKGDMNTAVYRAANLGGDSDSTASIVSAMSVCATGDLFKEQDEIQYVQDIDVLRSVSRKFASMIAEEDN